jgi:hypothetical protein
MRKIPAFFALLVTAAVGQAACSSKKPPEAVAPTIDAGDPEAGFDAGDTAAMPDAGEADAAEDAAAATVGNIIEQAADSAIDLEIANLAKTAAPGMQPEGQPGRATLAQGESFNMIVTMQPGRCYTFVGFSPAGQVTQLDLRLLAPPLYNIEAGRAVNEKNKPVIGKGKGAQCPALPIAVPYRIDATATKGQGRIGLFVFSKAK